MESLLSHGGGHGMPPGETVGEQLVLWSFLNINVPVLWHQDYGICHVTWWRVFSDQGEAAIPIAAYDNVLRIRAEDGRIVPLDTPVEGWKGEFWSTWKIELGNVDDIIERLDRDRRDDNHPDKEHNSVGNAARACNRVLGKLPGADWVAHCYMNEGEAALRAALAEYIALNA